MSLLPQLAVGNGDLLLVGGEGEEEEEEVLPLFGEPRPPNALFSFFFTLKS